MFPRLFLGARVHISSFVSCLSGTLDIFQRTSARLFPIQATPSVDALSLLHVFHRDDVTLRGTNSPREFLIAVALPPCLCDELLLLHGKVRWREQGHWTLLFALNLNPIVDEI
jgi:hypothetical protein